MSKLIFALTCALLAVPALAEDQGSVADMANPPASEQKTAQGAAAPGSAPPGPASQGSPTNGSPTQTPTDEAPADVDMANVRSAGQAASSPSAAAPGQAQPEQPQPAAAGGEQQQTEVEQPKSSIPLDKRRGPDITDCLNAGDKSDKAINACADKYRPRSR